MKHNINPYLSYTKTKKELKEILLETGGWTFFNGEMFDVKSKHLGAGVYSVWLAKRKFKNSN